MTVARWRFVRTHRRTLLLLGAVSFACYFPASWWGAPHATASDRADSWAVDDETPLGPLAEIDNIRNPKPDRRLGYPLLYSFTVAAAYAPYLGARYLDGDLRPPSGVYPFGLQDPPTTLRRLSNIAHLVTVLFAVGCVLGAFSIGTLAWDRDTGLLTALLTLTLFPMFYYGRTGNVDVPVLMFIAWGTAAFAQCLRDGFTVRNAAWLGTFTGLALATKESAAGVFVLLPLVLLAGVRLERGEREPFSARVKPALAGLVATFLALGATSGLFIEPGRYFDHLRFLSGQLDRVAVDVSYVVETFPYSFDGSVAFAVRQWEFLVDTMTLPGVLLALAGLAVVLARERRYWPMILPVLGYANYMFWTARVAHLRYLLPTALLLTPFAARAVIVGWRSGSPPRRAGVGVLAVAALGLGGLRGLDLTHSMLNDSRHAAADWLAERTQAGDLIEHFGHPQKLPHLEEGVRTAQATPYLGIFRPTDRSEATTAQILNGWAQRRPKFVLVSPDLTSASAGGPYNISMPPSLYERMLNGETPYTLVRTFDTAPLLPWVRRPPLDYPTVSPTVRVFALRPEA